MKDPAATSQEFDGKFPEGYSYHRPFEDSTSYIGFDHDNLRIVAVSSLGSPLMWTWQYEDEIDYYKMVVEMIEFTYPEISQDELELKPAPRQPESRKRKK